MLLFLLFDASSKMKHKLRHAKRGTNFLNAVFSVIPTGWTPAIVHFYEILRFGGSGRSDTHL